MSRPSLPTSYVLPRVWKKPSEGKDFGGRFTHINSDVSGARFTQALPCGEHRYQLYSLGTPNGVMVTFALEELGVEYDAFSIDLSRGEQFGSGFVAVNPNSKIPAMLDKRFDPPLRVFETGSILLHLAEQEGRLLPPPAQPRARAEVLNWLMWRQGAAPFMGGGFGHFFAYAPVAIEYAIDRYSMEVKRMLDVLDRHLADGREFMVPEAGLSIADISIAPWIYTLYRGYRQGDVVSGDFLQVEGYQHLFRWMQAMTGRPAYRRGRRVNGLGKTALKERHSAKDFDQLSKI